MSPSYCPATMCPLFAIEGSPWTGDQNAPCPRTRELPMHPGGGCGWWQGFGGCGCDGATAAMQQIADVERCGATLQLGPVQHKRARSKPRAFDCPRAADCQWQRESGDQLCPPRLALAKGIDPKACAY